MDNERFDLDFKQFREDHQNLQGLKATGYRFLYNSCRYIPRKYVIKCLEQYPDDSNCLVCLAYIKRETKLFEKAIALDNYSAYPIYTYYCASPIEPFNQDLCQKSIDYGDQFAPSVLAKYKLVNNRVDPYNVSDETYELYKLSAARGHGQAKFELANIHIHSKNRYNPEEALKYLMDIGEDTQQIPDKDLAQIKFIVAIITKRKNKIQELKQQLYYTPEGPGYQEALKHFESLQ